MVYTEQQLRKIFQSRFDAKTWTEFIINFFKAQTLYREPENLDMRSEDGIGYYWGDLMTSDDTLISFFYFKMQGSIEHRKVGLAKLIKKYIKGVADVGIGVFDDGDRWRLSYVTNMRGEETSPKRNTFLFGVPENHYHTPISRFLVLQKNGITNKNIKEAFSVEALTKQFYNDLYDWYIWALKEDTGVYFPKTPDKERNRLDTKMIRLITRLMFVWFIKQKGLVPDALFNPDEISHWLIDFDPQSMTSANYYQAILQNLFFATLNRPIKTISYDKDGNEVVERRCFATLKDRPDVKSKYRYQELFKVDEDTILRIFEQIPFINGGLFECLDKNKTSDGVEQACYEDGFSRNTTIKDGRWTKRAFVPNKLFFDDDNGIINIFSRYNFTVEENSPQEQQIALDPELLGKVFENLLGAYNPETKKIATARESSGTFYTPRTIVNYMIDRSLEMYLGNTVEVKALFADDFVFDPQKESFYNEVINKLTSIKVLDPACGSGAFPIGVLNRIVEILQNLNAPGTKYDLKLQVMENCIYGGDIQTIAAQITKLRFFISLVCDCDKSKKPDDNFGIPNLPNLETHFVTADSLVGLIRPKQYSLFEKDVIELQKKLHKVRHQHFTAKTVYLKNKLRDEDKRLRDELVVMLQSDNIIANKSAHLMAAWNPYDQNGVAYFFDSDWMFGIKEFDIVIGNPPYVQAKKGIYSPEQFPYSEGKDIGKQNLYKLFVEHSFNMAKNGSGIACMIVQSSLMCDLSSKFTRELLLKKTELEYLIEFPKTAPTRDGQVFESVCQGTCIYLFRKKNPSGKPFLLSVNNDCTTLDNLNVEYVSQKALLDFYPEDFALPLLKEGEFEMLKAIKLNSNKLMDFIKDVAQGDMNLTTAKNRIKVNDTGVKLLRGRHISSYYIDYNVDEYIDRTYRQEYVKANRRTAFILCQEVTGTVDPRRLHCCVSDTNESFLCGHTINKLNLINPSYCLLIMGILNSKLLDWVFRKTSSNNHVGGYELKQLPIIIPKDTSPFEDIISQIINQKRISMDSSALESKLDILIYRLYQLPYSWAKHINETDLGISEDEYNRVSVE